MCNEVEKILEKMKQLVIIEEFPTVLVQKNNGSIIFHVSFRKLNAVTEKDSYSILRIDNLLDLEVDLLL